ncbi:unnamed protein product [Mesocestoides corti]|uniref:Robl_LC7 domain-containing protein n=1 Tax=Mesocestoides corti TaxID=53468 RepID=A0A0R3UCX2_MESCO|nr:unnamed protein product [Mesocestoides corti]
MGPKESTSEMAKVLTTFNAAVLAYLTSEIRELAGIAAHDVDMTRVLPSRIHLAARNNDLRMLIICNIGALPNTQDALQPTMAH